MDSCLGWLPLLAEKNNAYVFAIVAILAASVPMLLRIYRYQARSKRGTAVRPAAELDPRGLRAGAPESIVRWEVQMQELARDLKAEIDSKMVALGHVIRDADRAAERLEKALGCVSRHDSETAGKELGQSPELCDSERAALREEVYLLADYGFSANDIASRLSIPVGQTELIMGLREEKRQAHSVSPFEPPPGRSSNDR